MLPTVMQVTKTNEEFFRSEFESKLCQVKLFPWHV